MPCSCFNTHKYPYLQVKYMYLSRALMFPRYSIYFFNHLILHLKKKKYFSKLSKKSSSLHSQVSSLLKILFTSSFLLLHINFQLLFLQKKTFSISTSLVVPNKIKMTIFFFFLSIITMIENNCVDLVHRKKDL